MAQSIDSMGISSARLWHRLRRFCIFSCNIAFDSDILALQDGLGTLDKLEEYVQADEQREARQHARCQSAGRVGHFHDLSRATRG